MASFPPHPERGSRIRDPTFTEAISKNMRIPEHLSAGPSQRWGAEPREPPPAYSMHVPDRLTYTGADMSPRPMFSPAKAALSPPFALEPCWESRDPELFPRESVQSPMRRSYSDQGFGRTPPGTPTHPRNALVVQSPPPSSFGAPPTPGPPAAPVNTESSRKRGVDSWNQEDEGGAAVEIIILRRQVMKMSRRLASLERQNTERRSTELALFSLLLSAVLLNCWLWIRR